MRPILILCFGMLAISVNDLLFKFLSGDYSLHQLVFNRTLVALAILLPLFVSRIGMEVFRTSRPVAMLVRSGLVVCANLVFFTSLAALPLAETTGIVFISPLLLTCFAFLFLGEQVGWVRWLCIGVGFIGTMLIMRPFTEGFEPLMILPLIAAFFYAGFTSMTRVLRDTEPTERLAFYALFGFLVTSGLFGLIFSGGVGGFEDSPTLSFLFREWRWPSVTDWGFITLIGICSGIIALALAAAYRLGEASLLAPFEYIALPLSALWGYLVWQETPDGLSLFGMTLIVSAGIFLAYREIAKGRRHHASLRSMTAQGRDFDE